MKNFHQILGLFFALVFLLFTYWQFNDPDPILWVSIYLIPVYSSFQFSRGKINKELMIILLLLSFVAGLQTWSEMTAFEGFNYENLSMKSHNQELAREAVGLWIVSLSYLVYLILAKIKK